MSKERIQDQIAALQEAQSLSHPQYLLAGNLFVKLPKPVISDLIAQDLALLKSTIKE